MSKYVAPKGRAAQDAQVAKQAKEQVAYSAAQRAKANTPAAKAKNITIAKREEAKAAQSNHTALASRRPKASAPKELEKGSGALVGVAKGAMDGQPHTKRAVEEARVRMNGETREAETKLVIAKLEAEAKTAPKFVSGVEFPSAKAAAARRATVIQSLQHTGKQPKPDTSGAPKPAKAKKTATPKAPAADAAKKIVLVAKANPYREGTKAYATFELFKTAKTVGEARAKAEAAGGSGAAGKYDIGYLRYASRDGHIKLV